MNANTREDTGTNMRKLEVDAASASSVSETSVPVAREVGRSICARSATVRSHERQGRYCASGPKS